MPETSPHPKHYHKTCGCAAAASFPHGHRLEIDSFRALVASCQVCMRIELLRLSSTATLLSSLTIQSSHSRCTSRQIRSSQLDVHRQLCHRYNSPRHHHDCMETRRGLPASFYRRGDVSLACCTGRECCLDQLGHHHSALRLDAVI